MPSAGRDELRFEVHDVASQPSDVGVSPRTGLTVAAGIECVVGRFCSRRQARDNGEHSRRPYCSGIYLTGAQGSCATRARTTCCVPPFRRMAAYWRPSPRIMTSCSRGSIPMTAPHRLENGNERAVALAFSTDSKILLAVSAEGAIGVWDTKTHKLSQRLLGRRGPVQSVAIAPDNASLLIACGDRTGTVDAAKC